MERRVSDPEELLKIANALSSITRINILNLVAEKPLDVTDLSQVLGMTKSNVSAHIASLEEAGLIEVKYENGKKGIRKMVSLKHQTIVISLGSNAKET